jgi:Tryptophan/tyrosine permease family
MHVYCLQVGAGVLALPAATLQAGALPSSLVLIAVWMYMCCTGLLIAEVNVNVMCRCECVCVHISIRHWLSVALSSVRQCYRCISNALL